MQGGELVSFTSVDYPFMQPSQGWAEQNGEDVWRALVKALRQCIRSSNLGVEKQIKAVCIVGTAVSMIASDKNGKLLMPAIMWMDTRATREAEELSSAQSDWLKLTGGKLSPEWMLPKSLWMKRNKPDIYAGTYRIAELTDWLDYRLTGNWTTSLTTASAEWSYCRQYGGWPIDLLKQNNLDDLIERFPTQILQPGEIVGTLSKKTARELELPPGIIVAKGLMDSYSAALGLGVFYKDRVAISIGTSSAYITLLESPRFNDKLVGTIPDAFGIGTWALQGGQTSAGAIIQWFADQIGNQTSIAAIDDYAKEIPPGSEGLLALDCWQGSRTPYRDPLARGALLGLSLKHSAIHIYHALLEAVAFGGRQILDTMRLVDVDPKELFVCGGGTQSHLLMKIHADVIGIPLILAPYPDITMLGGAICSAVAGGIYPDLRNASTHMSPVGTVIQPNIKTNQAYQPFYEEYCRLYPALRDLFRNIQKAYSNSQNSANKNSYQSKLIAPGNNKENC